MPESISVTDGLIRIRPFLAEDAGLLRSRGIEPPGRPDGADSRIGTVLAADQACGWIGYDADERLADAQVRLRLRLGRSANAGREAQRALQLLMHHLATRTTYETAVLRVPAGDTRWLEVAAESGFMSRSDEASERVLFRQIPPVTYTDGAVTIRRQRVEDIDAHMAGIDDAQIDWLWLPGDRDKWLALTARQQRARNLDHLRAMHDSFGSGPKWTFSVDSASATYIAYVDCDLANDHVPAGEANISYTAHPAYRGQGNVSRAVRLVAQFLRDHTGARSAHIVVDPRNAASLRVARAVGAAESGQWRDEYGRLMIRHVLPLR